MPSFGGVQTPPMDLKRRHRVDQFAAAFAERVDCGAELHGSQVAGSNTAHASSMMVMDSAVSVANILSGVRCAAS